MLQTIHSQTRRRVMKKPSYQHTCASKGYAIAFFIIVHAVIKRYFLLKIVFYSSSLLEILYELQFTDLHTKGCKHFCFRAFYGEFFIIVKKLSFPDKEKISNVIKIKAPQALHNTPPLLGALKVILRDI